MNRMIVAALLTVFVNGYSATPLYNIDVDTRKKTKTDVHDLIVSYYGSANSVETNSLEVETFPKFVPSSESTQNPTSVASSQLEPLTNATTKPSLEPITIIIDVSNEYKYNYYDDSWTLERKIQEMEISKPLPGQLSEPKSVPLPKPSKKPKQSFQKIKKTSEDSQLYHKFGWWKNPPKSIRSLPKVKRKLTLEEATRFQNAMLEVINSKSDSKFRKEFIKAKNEYNYLYSKAPCAYSHSRVMYYVAKRAGLDGMAKFWENPRNFAPTHNNEHGLAEFGFKLYDARKFIAPKGSIAMWSRCPWNGVLDHSGHIMTVISDNAKEKKGVAFGTEVGQDELRIIDNAGFNRVYTGSSYFDSFWAFEGVHEILPRSLLYAKK